MRQGNRAAMECFAIALEGPGAAVRMGKVIEDAIRAAVAEERAACAHLAACSGHHDECLAEYGKEIAAAIRAREEKGAE